MLQHLIIHFSIIISQVVAYGRLKIKEKFKLLALHACGRGLLQEVPNIVI